MKKQLIILFTLTVISLISFTSCEPFIENKITIENQSDGTIWLNVKANKHIVNPGETVVLGDFDRGLYEYETIYTVPYDVASTTAEGDASGTMNIIGGTEIYIIYTSALTGTGTGSKYTLFASMTSSDDINRPDPFGEGD